MGRVIAIESACLENYCKNSCFAVLLVGFGNFENVVEEQEKFKYVTGDGINWCGNCN